MAHLFLAVNCYWLFLLAIYIVLIYLFILKKLPLNCCNYSLSRSTSVNKYSYDVMSTYVNLMSDFIVYFGRNLVILTSINIYSLGNYLIKF